MRREGGGEELERGWWRREGGAGCGFDIQRKVELIQSVHENFKREIFLIFRVAFKYMSKQSG